MKKLIATFMLGLLTVSAGAQRIDVNDVLKACPKKAYGNDCPYQFEDVTLTKAPDGYKPFISATIPVMARVITGTISCIWIWTRC